MISRFANLQQPLELLDFHVVHRPKKQRPFESHRHRWTRMPFLPPRPRVKTTLNYTKQFCWKM
jgi:hypothetical protein